MDGDDDEEADGAPLHCWCACFRVVDHQVSSQADSRFALDDFSGWISFASKHPGARDDLFTVGFRLETFGPGSLPFELFNLLPRCCQPFLDVVAVSLHFFT